MRIRPRYLAHGAILAALYLLLTYFQNLLLPGSGSWMIQFRLAEILCVLAFFTPAAAPGLAVGCLVFNLSFSAALPLDFLLGAAATYLACRGMWKTRNCLIFGLPLPGLLLPALTNMVLIGWQLSFYMGGGFFLNAIFVAAGELVVLLGPGSILYCAIKRRKLHRFFV